VLFPIVLPVMVMDAAAADTLMAVILPEMVAVVPVDVKAPSVLFVMATVFVDPALIPTTAPSEVDEVASNEPVPVVAPMVLPEILALPAVRLIPHNIPFVVVAPLLVVIEIDAMVFPEILLTAPPAVNEQLIPIYLSATVEV